MATFKISTKVDKDAKAVDTMLTVNGGSADTWKALGMQALVVKVQGKFRKDGVIPTAYTLDADEWAPGTRHGGEITIDEARNVWKAEYAKATPERKAQMLKELTA